MVIVKNCDQCGHIIEDEEVDISLAIATSRFFFGVEPLPIDSDFCSLECLRDWAGARIEPYKSTRKGADIDPDKNATGGGLRG